MSKKERAFLHELMNLLTIADGNCRRVKRSLDSGEKENIDSYLEKIQTALGKMITNAHERREILIKNEGEENNNDGVI